MPKISLCGDRTLKSSVRFMSGVGEKRAAALSALGIETIEDLLFFFPKRYEDRRNIVNIRDLRDGINAAVIAEVLSLSFPPVYSSAPLAAELSDGTGVLKAVWFGGRYMAERLKEGSVFALYGNVSVDVRSGLFKMTNPEAEEFLDGVRPSVIGSIVPIYRVSAQLPQKRIRALIDSALESFAGQLADFVPKGIRMRHGMRSLCDAVREIHHPGDPESWTGARNRLAFNELFLLQTGLLLRRINESANMGGDKSGSAASRSVSIRPCAGYDKFISSLPFPLTSAQTRSINEIMADLDGDKPMNRLLQGDVGSGKTMVAAAALTAAFDSGFQSAFMAPTEILAQQHYIKLRKIFEPSGIRTALLTGGMRASEKKAVLDDIKKNNISIIIGTHSLMTDDVIFHDLGLVIIDEQHRFGVMQRKALTSKGRCPHVLVMTATPIPRTLVLSVYGDLDVSVLDEMPAGRIPVRTLKMRDDDFDSLADMIHERVRLHQQIYWVCPLIEESEESSDLGDVVSAFKRLSRLLPSVRTEMLHGRMSMTEKAETMRKFSAGETDMLVSTVVIEVGVDVPNASMIVIEDAAQFGLAQLHQLRGRVGRGSAESVCVLLEGRSITQDGRERLKSMLEISDGFKLAEADLMQRGPGEVCGVHQHGVTDFRIADLLHDTKILNLAKREASELLNNDPQLISEPLLKAEVMRKLGDALHIAGTA